MCLIAIDLTPLRSGGENGGLKIFTLELLKFFQKEEYDQNFLVHCSFHLAALYRLK